MSQATQEGGAAWAQLERSSFSSGLVLIRTIVSPVLIFGTRAVCTKFVQPERRLKSLFRQFDAGLHRQRACGAARRHLWPAVPAAAAAAQQRREADRCAPGTRQALRGGS